MKSILITGHLGFIGQALYKEMAAHDWLIAGYDIASSSRLDVTQRIQFDAALHHVKPDVVVHLAAEVGKLNCEQNPARALEVNVGGTLNVANACALHEIPLVYCSTSEVYGDHKEWVVAEDCMITRPTSGMYGMTKWWGEHVARTYAPEGLKIIRPTMPYGPGVPPGPGRRALDNLVWQALTGQPMIVHRGAARSWCWIDDLASGIRMVIEKGNAGVYNVGRDDDEVSMLELAQSIDSWVSLQAISSAHLPGPIKVIDPPARQTAIKRISCFRLRALGWEPKVSLDDGLPEMVKWIKECVEKDSVNLQA